MPPTILITRPEPAASGFADTLISKWGGETQVLLSPVMQIVYRDVPLDLSGIETLIFTSVHGVEAFARLTERRDLPCYVVGMATAQMAQRHGLSASVADGNANALCRKIIKDSLKGPFLHVRGEHAAKDIVAFLSDRGLTARDIIGYGQEPLALSEKAKNLLTGQSPVLLPVFSPRSAALLFEDLCVSAPVFVAAISQNVANALPDYPFERVMIAKTPDAAALLDCLECLRQDAILVESTNRAQ